MSKQKLAMTRKAGLSPANNLPLITYKRGTSQQTMCVLKKYLKGEEKYITLVTAAASIDPAGTPARLGLVILYAVSTRPGKRR